MDTDTIYELAQDIILGNDTLDNLKSKLTAEEAELLLNAIAEMEEQM